MFWEFFVVLPWLFSSWRIIWAKIRTIYIYLVVILEGLSNTIKHGGKNQSTVSCTQLEIFRENPNEMSHYNRSRNSFHKQHALAGRVCLLGGVNHAQQRMDKPLSIGDCCQGDGVPIMGQCLMCTVCQRNFCLDYKSHSVKS